ncbi:MAG: endonuclease VIII [Candidatus Bathyarchaeota archaeon]|nr:endonuclease VIII [Candidatus Bathyarchaeota archaeon]
MIELPEATVIARQMSDELKGKTIESSIRGSSPHKFAFYTRSPEEYEAILKGKTMGLSKEHGSLILASVGPDHVLVFGGGGERILFHRSKDTLPQKHQLLLHFQDDTYLTVTVQGWGSVQLFHQSEIAAHPYVGKKAPSPLSDAFTFEYLQGLFGSLEEEDKRSIKYFVISEPGILGVGNGYLQDILFRAKIHPRKRSIDITETEKRALYKAIRTTLKQAVESGGRDTERDLYNHRGGYRRILDSKKVGQPCPECGTPIEKTQYLGGASYFCPNCQESP